MITTAASVWSLFPTGTCGHGCEPPIMIDVAISNGIRRKEVDDHGGTFEDVVFGRKQEDGRRRKAKAIHMIGSEVDFTDEQAAWCNTTGRSANDRVETYPVRSSLWSLPLTTYPSVGSRGCHRIAIIDIQLLHYHRHAALGKIDKTLQTCAPYKNSCN